VDGRLSALQDRDERSQLGRALGARERRREHAIVRRARAAQQSRAVAAKSLAVAERFGRPRYVAHQVYYSLGALVWSPLGWGRLTGKVRRGQPLPAQSRLHATAEMGPPVPDELLFRVVDALDAIAEETGRTIPQVAINWLLQRPTVASVIVGARDERQLRENLGAAGWALTPEQVAVLDAASAVIAPYPYFPYVQAEGFTRLNPPMVPAAEAVAA
jgi:aryl-alcohol dehydrogenase-like predicted oxidoreductase